jgi:ATP:ADP antiporter, AAA family
VSAALQRALNLRRDELAPVLMAALYFFLLLTSLMVLRPAREALGMQRGIEAVRWLFMGTLLVTLLVNPVFGWLVSRFRRMTFITATYLFFAANLVLFYGLLVLTPEAVGQTTGQVFYVWMSVFNLFATMVFWALMADRFSFERSKRVFGLVAVGGTAGAIAGSSLAVVLAGRIGTAPLLLVAAAFLGGAMASAFGVHRLTADWHATGETLADAVQDLGIIGGSPWRGFTSVPRSPFLLGISAYVLVLAVLVTFLYFTRLQMVAALGDDLDLRTGIFARIDLATQLATLLLQAMVAGQLMDRVGVAVTLALAPVTVALGFIGLALVGTLTALVVFEATFTAVRRAIMRPARESLFTVVGAEDKYKAKAFTDTFVYRGGDVLGAQTEGVLGRLGLGLGALAAVAVPLAMVWAAIGVWLGRTQARMAAERPPRPTRPDHAVLPIEVPDIPPIVSEST